MKGVGVNPKDKIGLTKVPLRLVPSALMIEVARVMELGAKKYGPYNWRTNKVLSTVYIEAAMRHLLSYLDGETLDTESGVSHLAHVAACMGILLDAESLGALEDDRPTKGAAAELIKKYSKNDPGTYFYFTRYEKLFPSLQVERRTGKIDRRTADWQKSGYRGIFRRLAIAQPQPIFGRRRHDKECK